MILDPEKKPIKGPIVEGGSDQEYETEIVEDPNLGTTQRIVVPEDNRAPYDQD